jgi:fatty acid desaturase
VVTGLMKNTENLKGFTSDLDRLKSTLKKGKQDIDHLRSIELVINICTVLGIASLWLSPNILTIMALAIGSFGRWTILGHHILHKAYDDIPGVPERFKSKVFAKGWRRYIDWFDWIEPQAWSYEHNSIHHFHLGERVDPDEAQSVSEPIRKFKAPVFLKRLYVLVFTLYWKAVFMAPNVTNAKFSKDAGLNLEEYPTYWNKSYWSLERLWEMSKKIWLPYIIGKFIFLPGLFLVVSVEAWQNALISLLVAEGIANVWSYWVMVPNHTNKDIYTFSDTTKSKSEFYLHQVLGTVNYKCGGDLNDFMHGWLNYQIEHHLFPDLTIRQYQKIQPKVKEICEKNGIPYQQKSIFRCMLELNNVVVGKETQCIYKE